MAASIKSYVDTSALIAFADGSDTYHPLFLQLFANPSALVTTALVVAEGHGWFLRRFDSARALMFLGMVEAMRPLKVMGVGVREQNAGVELLRRFSDQALTMTDAVGLYLMALQSIKNCWSTDSHLGLTGVPLVIHRY